jgi:hypothetical protein
MTQHTTSRTVCSSLVPQIQKVLQAHRPAFRQGRVYRRVVALVLASLLAFARQTVSQRLWTLGLIQADPSAWYRLFSRERFAMCDLAHHLFGLTLAHLAPTAPYVVGVDGTQIRRSSRSMPGTSWFHALGTAAFQPGLARAQRFVQGAWLPPGEEGYTRAVPLQFVPAFPEKAVPAAVAPCTEVAAGVSVVAWVRQELDEAGRAEQPLVVVADGSYDTLSFWQGLPHTTTALVRTARNRKLFALPPQPTGRGRPRKYGADIPKPAAWLEEKAGWQTAQILVRGRVRQLTYRVEGPVLRQGAPDIGLFLLVVRGSSWRVGRRRPRQVKREPTFYLVNGQVGAAGWQVPFAVETLLSWAWQRWELEVAHREMKSGFGVGDSQCWQVRSAVVAVQWQVWAYAVCVLAGYRTWGWLGGPSPPTRWWGGARRWSLNTLWRQIRAELWKQPDFQPLFLTTTGDWPKKEEVLVALSYAAQGAARA